MGALFGTDGIRGIAGSPPLDGSTIYRIGYCLAQHLKSIQAQPLILLARDTRESGPWIERVLVRAIEDANGISRVCGVISTPGVSFLTRELGAHAGIMISASHNPYQDNGIKIFASDGIKFSDAVEDALESAICASTMAAPGELAARPLEADRRAFQGVPDYIRIYVGHLRQCVDSQFQLAGMKLVVDCAHGSQTVIAPAFFSALGADLHVIHCHPDGRNINHNAGALHLESLKKEVISRGADLGIAFDGDADRAMFVDGAGAIRDGDDVLYLLASHADLGEAPRTIVGTVMANLGLEAALERIGFKLIRTAVGDRYVMEEMLRTGAVIGGEQSGHIILSRLANTGDGLLTAIKVLEILQQERKSIAEICSPMKRFPQVLRNVHVPEKVPFDQIKGLREAEAACKKMLGLRSRILLRYSGTEMLARIMVEGEDAPKVKKAARHLALFFERLG